MDQKQMTEREKADIFMKTIELKEAGRIEEADALYKTIPLPPYLAKIIKETFGAYYLICGGWNLAEAEAQYGSDWLNS